MKTVDITKYEFINKDVEFGLFFNLHSLLIAFIGVNAAWKEFCRNSGIDLPVIDGKKYILPRSYNLNNARLERMGCVRDKMIIASKRYYDKCCNHLAELKAANDAAILNRQEYIKDLKAQIAENEAVLKKQDDPQEIIAIQGKQGNLLANKKNQEQALGELQEISARINALVKHNKEAWLAQLELIEFAVKTASADFCRKIGRKITHVFGFDNFNYVRPEYGDNAKAILMEAKKK